MSTTDETNKDPGELPMLEVPMSQRTAARLAWASFALGGLSVLANTLTGAGFMPPVGMQVCGWFSAACTGVGVYLARKTPALGSRPKKE